MCPAPSFSDLGHGMRCKSGCVSAGSVAAIAGQQTLTATTKTASGRRNSLMCFPRTDKTSDQETKAGLTHQRCIDQVRTGQVAIASSRPDYFVFKRKLSMTID